MAEQPQDPLAELIAKLEQTRDELNLQLHLGKTEAQELWQETEDKWRKLRDQLDRLEGDTGDLSRDVGAAAMLAAEEIRQGYERLRKLF
jgi:hypothetical protein